MSSEEIIYWVIAVFSEMFIVLSIIVDIRKHPNKAVAIMIVACFTAIVLLGALLINTRTN